MNASRSRISFGNAFACAAFSLLLPGLALRAEPVAAPSSDLLAEALPVLQAKYVGFKDLDVKPGEKLDAVVARSHGTLSVGPRQEPPLHGPIVTAFLPGNIVYWHLGSFVPRKGWDALGNELQNQIVWGIGGAILDLRHNLTPDDYAGAAQVVNYFAFGDETLQKFIPQTENLPVNRGYIIADHPFRGHGPLIVLIDRQTSGAAEALAACLKADGALLIGEPTSGRGAVFAEQRLSSGQVLRYAVDHIRLSDGTLLWDHPVHPDITVTEDDTTAQSVLALIDRQQVLDVIHEATDRHRLSEAALVQGLDPEIETTSSQKPSTPTPQDIVLVSAIDSLKAIDLCQQHASVSVGTAR